MHGQPMATAHGHTAHGHRPWQDGQPKATPRLHTAAAQCVQCTVCAMYSVYIVQHACWCELTRPSPSAPSKRRTCTPQYTHTGCSLPHTHTVAVRSQRPAPTAAASNTYGSNSTILRSNTYGCSLQHLRLQPPAPRVAASSRRACSSLAVRPRSTRAGGRASPQHGMRPPVMGSTTWGAQGCGWGYRVGVGVD